jgi:DNA-binding response OmpR family regulator
MKTATHISIIEHDASLCDALQRILISHGFSVSLYHCAENFLAQDNRNRTDLVLSDVNMQGMDGFELLRELKAQNNSPPVILMSGSCVIQKERVLELGAAAFLTKPFHLAELLREIQLGIPVARPA